MTQKLSDEMINAYIDNQLAPKDLQLIIKQMKNNVELRVKIDKLKSLKNIIKKSYVSVSQPINLKKRQYKINPLFPASLAASITLLFGIGMGWYSHSYIGISDTSSNYLLGIKLKELKPKDNKIIIHLSQNDVELFDQALTKAEKLLAYFDTIKNKGKVHILANSFGLDILRTNTSPYQERIIKMMQTYDSVEFVACQNTLKRLESSGKDTKLLPGVKVHGPVINEIISSLQDGWTYISI